MKTIIIYVVSVLLDYSFEDWREMENEEFIATYNSHDETGGRSYDPEDFAEAFNVGEIDPNVDYIRIIETMKND